MRSLGDTQMEITNNKDLSRYEIRVDGHLALLEYIEGRNKIYLTHTEVPPPIGNRGIAARLVKTALEEADEKGLKIIPICSYVMVYIERHPEWKKLLST